MVRRNMEPGIGRWTFPAGFVDRGESVEEADLKVRLNGLVGVYSKTGETIVLIVYSGDVIGGTLAAGPRGPGGWPVRSSRVATIGLRA